MKLHAFMTHPYLAGVEFSGPSWSTWRMIARLIDGDAHLLTLDEQNLALKLTGRRTLPTAAPREVYVGTGRRSGKSRFGSLVAVWLAAEHYPQLAAGENAVVVNVAPARKQATIDLDYSRGLIDGSDLLVAERGSTTADTVTFKHRTQLEVVTASYRTIRGRTLAGAVIDESAFLRSDDSALPDLELDRVARPVGLVSLQETSVAMPDFKASVQPESLPVRPYPCLEDLESPNQRVNREVLVHAADRYEPHSSSAQFPSM
jgi:hypothetical protein